MNCCSNKISMDERTLTKAFTLAEVVAALVVLTLITSSVLIVVSRCIKATIDQKTKIRAFQIARENMEKLLAATSIAETLEQGFDDKNPNIEWQTVVEPFYEPLTSRMWIRAVCSASYTDSDDERQTIEFTHWLTNLTKKQVLDIIKQKQQEKEELLAQGKMQEFVLEHIDGVPKDILLQLHNEITGQEITAADVDDFDAIKDIVLEHLESAGGEQILEDLYDLIPETDKKIGKDDGPQPSRPEPKEPSGQPRTNLICGYTMEEFDGMSFEDIWRVFMNCDEL